MDVTSYPRYLFWNYAHNVMELPDEVVVRRVLLYGDVEDMQRLHRHAGPEKLARFATRLRISGRFPKRANYIEKILLAGEQ